MSNALFINLLGHGHVNPTIGLVKELMNRGEQVTYIAGEEFRSKIEKTGAKFKSYKNSISLSNPISGSFNSGDIKERLKGIGNTFEDIIEIVFESKADKFDYIIYDSAFIIGQEVGRVLDIPTICSITTFAMNESTNVFTSQFSDFGSRIQDLMNNADYLNFVKGLLDKYSIKFPIPSSIVDTFAGSCMIKIVFTSRFFQPNSDSFDESYKFIGSSIANRKEDMSFSLETNDKKKIIYISLGTIFNNSIEFYESCFKAFDNMDVKIIMSVGKNTDISAIKSIPSNFIVRDYVPQLEVLKRVDVFITHGGMNSTNEGLYYDVPLILIPQFGDQPFVANRVAELGAGIVIEKDNVTPEVLKQSVVKILTDNSFKLNSKKVGESLREAGGYEKGVDEILNLRNFKC